MSLEEEIAALQKKATALLKEQATAASRKAVIEDKLARLSERLGGIQWNDLEVAIDEARTRAQEAVQALEQALKEAGIE